MMEKDTMMAGGKVTITEELISTTLKIAELMPGGFFVYCASGYKELLFVNSVMVETYGCENADDFMELTGKSFKGMVLKEDYVTVDRNITIQTREGGKKPEPVEYRIQTKGGDLRWLQHYGRQIETDKYGKVYVVFAYDITEKTIRVQEDRRKAEVIRGLSKDFNAIYLIDFETHQMLPYSTNNGVSKSMRYAFNNALDYETTIQEFADIYVLPDEYDFYMYETSVERIRERIMGEQSYTVAFHRYNEKHLPELVHMTISRVEDKNRFNRIVMSYKTVAVADE